MEQVLTQGTKKHHKHNTSRKLIWSHISQIQYLSFFAFRPPFAVRALQFRFIFFFFRNFVEFSFWTVLFSCIFFCFAVSPSALSHSVVCLFSTLQEMMLTFDTYDRDNTLKMLNIYVITVSSFMQTRKGTENQKHQIEKTKYEEICNYTYTQSFGFICCFDNQFGQCNLLITTVVYLTLFSAYWFRAMLFRCLSRYPSRSLSLCSFGLRIVWLPEMCLYHKFHYTPSDKWIVL